jgi:hypothetical protein
VKFAGLVTLDEPKIRHVPAIFGCQYLSNQELLLKRQVKVAETETAEKHIDQLMHTALAIGVALVG